MINDLVSLENFLANADFCKQKESAFQALFLFIYFFNNAANQKLYLLDLLDNWKSTYVKKYPPVTLTFCTLLLCRSIIYSKANNSRNILLYVSRNILLYVTTVDENFPVSLTGIKL